jgi:branched-chain amino acid transport system permease protein
MSSSAPPLSPPDASRQRRLPAGSGWLAAVLALVVLAMLPWFAGFSTQRLLVEVFTVFAIATAWNLLAGFGGLIVVGQHVFVGIGAYSLFYLSNTFDLNPWLTLPLAALVAAVFAAATAWPMFRLSGAYFAVGTWVLAEIVRIAVLDSEPLGAGAGMPLESLANYTRAERNAGLYWAALAVGTLALGSARFLVRGRLGLALASVRDGEAAARASGVSVKRVKFAIWTLMAALTGAAGAVAYMSTMQVSPDASFGLGWTATAIFIVVLGGIGRIEGPVVGTVLFFALREFASDFGAWYFVVLGLLAIVTMVVAPGGIWGWLSRRWPHVDLLGIRRWMPSRPD